MDNRACPKCKESGHDKGGNHLFLMRDGSTWTCRRVEYHQDGKVYYEGLSPETATETETDGNRELLRMFGSKKEPVGKTETEQMDKTYRGILPHIYQKYEVRCTKDSSGNLTQLVHELRDLKGAVLTTKVRKLPKTFFIEGSTGSIPLQFFGQHQIPKAKRLLITEGELDALSAYQMLEKYKVAVWSLPLGANKKAILDNIDAITAFTKGNKELYFSMDSDEAGQKVAKELAGLFPSAKFLKLGRKDANSYLDDPSPDPEGFISAFWDAEIWRPPSIIRVSDILDDVFKKPEMGREWPWPSLTKLTYGRRDGEGMFIGAGEICQRLWEHSCRIV